MEQSFDSNRSSSHSTDVPKIAQTNDNTDGHEPEHKEGFLAEVIKFSLLALIIVLPIRLFVAQPFIVSGASMETTFTTGQYLIVDQLTYRFFEEPKRGDVIVFRYPKDTSKFFIKRIIAIPGDTISIAGNKVTLRNTEYPDGVRLEESYVREMSPNTTLTETLGESEYFVMGDNRNASSDSRAWGILPRDYIVGRAFVRLFPLTAIELLPGKYNIDAELAESAQQ